jgi:hypothetical protein
MKGLIAQAQQPQPKGQRPQGPQAPAQQGRPQQPPQGPGGQPPQGQQQGKPQQEANTQEAYDVATGQMLQFVYSPKGTEAVTGYIEAAGDPEQGMAKMIGRLLVMTVQSAQMNGKRLPPDLIMQSGIEVSRALSEVAQKNGLLDPAQEKAVTESAFFDGIAFFATEARAEALSDDERQRYIQLLDMVEKIESQGGMPGPDQSPKRGAQQKPKQKPKQKPQPRIKKPKAPAQERMQ